jgi:hypothetical protein
MSGAITLFVGSVQAVVNCPSCQWEAIPVRLRLRVRKFFCPNSECNQRIFCEQLPEVVGRYAHRTNRLNEVLSSIGFALGGRPGAKAVTKLGMQTGADSILRRVRKAAARPPDEIKVRNSRYPSKEGGTSSCHNFNYVPRPQQLGFFRQFPESRN